MFDDLDAAEDAVESADFDLPWEAHFEVRTGDGSGPRTSRSQTIRPGTHRSPGLAEFSDTASTVIRSVPENEEWNLWHARS